MCDLVLDTSSSMLRVTPTVNPTLGTEGERMAISCRNLGDSTYIHDKLWGDLILQTFLALSQSENSVCILAHAIYKSILRKDMYVGLATSNHFD